MFSVQQALVFRSDRSAYVRFPVVEIVAQLIHFVGLLALGHHRPSYPFAGEGVKDSPGIDDTAVHVIVHPLGGQGHILVLDRYVPVVVDEPLAIGKHFYNRVARVGEGRHREGTVLQGFEGIHPEQGVGAVNTVPARKSRGIRRSHLLLRAGTSGKGLGTLLRTLRQSICADQKEENADGGKVFVYIIAQFFQYICKRQI